MKIYRLFISAAVLVVLTCAVITSGFAETLETEHFRIEYSGAGKVFAKLVADIAENGYRTAEQALNHSPDGKITILLTKERAEFDKLTRNALPDWTSAVSLSRDRIVLSPLAGQKMGLERILPHEIVHCFIDDAAGLTFVPRWFHEGLAEMISGSLGIRSTVLLTLKSIRGDLLSFVEIQQVFSADSSVAMVAYDQSHLAVMHLADLHGQTVYADIIAGLDRGDSFDKAFESATGVSPDRYEREYIAWVRQNYNFRTLLSYIPGTWSAILILAFIAYAATKLRSRRIMKRWEDEDRPGNIIDFDRFPPDDD